MWQHTMSNIIETKNYNEQIIDLWQRSFGDTREDVLFFLENCKNCICVCDTEYKSMLFLVDCNIDGLSCKYIYSACTDIEHRKSGLMSRLLNYCKCKYKKIALIPADEKLIDYYSKRGFNGRLDTSKIIFNEIDQIQEYLLEGCSLDEPFAMLYKGE